MSFASDCAAAEATQKATVAAAEAGRTAARLTPGATQASLAAADAARDAAVISARQAKQIAVNTAAIADGNTGWVVGAPAYTC